MTYTVPDNLIAAMEAGELTQSQLRELIRIEAESIGLTFDEAIDRAKKGTLPGCHIGSDIDFLIEMLS